MAGRCSVVPMGSSRDRRTQAQETGSQAVLRQSVDAGTRSSLAPVLIVCLQDLLGCGRRRLLHCGCQHAHVHRLQHPHTQEQQDPDAVSVTMWWGGGSNTAWRMQQW